MKLCSSISQVGQADKVPVHEENSRKTERIFLLSSSVPDETLCNDAFLLHIILQIQDGSLMRQLSSPKTKRTNQRILIYPRLVQKYYILSEIEKQIKYQMDVQQ